MKARKVIKWSALALVLVIVIAVTIVYFKLNSIVEYAVETQGKFKPKIFLRPGGIINGAEGFYGVQI